MSSSIMGEYDDCAAFGNLECCDSIEVAVRTNNLAALKRLINYGEHVHKEDEDGWRPLHVAAAAGHLDCLKELVQHRDTDLNWQTVEDEETAVFLAANYGHPEALQVLLSAGADPNICARNRVSPLHCVMSQVPLVADGLEPRQQSACVRVLLAFMAKINRQDCSKSTPIHRAIASIQNSAAKTEIILRLLNKKGIDLKLKNNKQRGVLHMAAEKGDVDTLKVLMSHSQSLKKHINDVDSAGWSALKFACHSGSLECVKFLNKNGADFVTLIGRKSSKTSYMLKALRFAIKLDVDICRYLLSMVPAGYCHSVFLQMAVKGKQPKSIHSDDCNYTCRAYQVKNGGSLLFVAIACEYSFLTDWPLLTNAQILQVVLEAIYKDCPCPKQECLLLSSILNYVAYHHNNFEEDDHLEICKILIDFGAATHGLANIWTVDNNYDDYAVPIEMALGFAYNSDVFEYMMEKGAGEHFKSLSQLELLWLLKKFLNFPPYYELLGVAFRAFGYLLFQGNCRLKPHPNGTRILYKCITLQIADKSSNWVDAFHFSLGRHVPFTVYLLKLFYLYGGRGLVNESFIQDVLNCFNKPEKLTDKENSKFHALLHLVRTPSSLRNSCSTVIGRHVQINHPGSFKQRINNLTDCQAINELLFRAVYELDGLDEQPDFSLE